MTQASCEKAMADGPDVREFPAGFIWGTATSAYQVEGAWTEGGKGRSIWDYFAHTQGKVHAMSNADMACDQYHRIDEDVKLMSDMGLKYYRLSIAWTRIQPTGTGPANLEGVAYYNRVIDALIAAGIEPVVTLYHWDLPLTLQVERNGWLGGEYVINAYVEYARLCFHHFGDRVKSWITFNEPWCVTVLGFCTGEHAPGRKGQPWTEPYIAGHNLLLAHARAVKLYREEYKSWQEGLIGITCNSDWREPLPDGNPSRYMRNCEAAERTRQFFLGWFADPVYFGDYPELMKVRLGDRLPTFTPAERALMKGSSDFFGLNHYTTTYVADAQPGCAVGFTRPEGRADWVVVANGKEREAQADVTAPKDGEAPQWGVKSLWNWVQGAKDDEGLKVAEKPAKAAVQDANSVGWFADQGSQWTYDPNWAKTDMGWAIVPWGLRKMVGWIQKRYHPEGGIIITENGCACKDSDVAVARCDKMRVEYLHGYISELHKAITEDGVDCRGYFVWSLMDNFEWAYGYSKRFGIHWVNYDTLERVPKESSKWFAKLLATNSVPPNV